MRKRFLLHKFLVLSILFTTTFSMVGCGGCGKEKETEASVEATASMGDKESPTGDGVSSTSDEDALAGNIMDGVSGSDMGTLDNNKGNGTDKGSGTVSGNATATSKPIGSSETTSGTGSGNGTGGSGSTATPTASPSATQKPSSGTTSTTAPTANPVATATPTTQPAVTSTPKPTVAPTAKPAATSTPKPTQTPGIAAHACKWNTGSITKSATCKEEGVMTYTCTVCNAVKTESIAKTDHKLNTVNVSATCTEPGTVLVVCEVCGYTDSNASSGSALGHDYYKSYNWGPPSCNRGAGYTLLCNRCGASGGEGRDEALPHTMVGTITFDGDCDDATIVEYTCSVCGAPGGRDSYYTDEHDWVTGLGAYHWSEEAQDFVQEEFTYCSKCERTQE